MSTKVCGDVWHKGKIVPVEVEVCANWLNQPGIVVHIPKEYYGVDEMELARMIDFRADLDKEVRLVNGVTTESLAPSSDSTKPKEVPVDDPSDLLGPPLVLVP